MTTDDAAGGIVVSRSLVIPEAELSWRFSRSSGPGGQGVNTTDSRAELSWDVDASTAVTDQQRERVRTALANRMVDGVITIAASEHRSQLRNREAAAGRLGNLVADALKPVKPRHPTRPSKGAQRRRAESKKRRSQTKALRRRPPR